MNTELLLSDKSFRWISTMYFYVSASADHAINPFKNLVDFLDVKVGDLGWGTDRDKSKSRFSADLTKVMQMRGYHIPEQEVRNCLSDDQMSNRSMAQMLAGFVK